MADEVPHHNHSEHEHGDGEKPAAKPGAPVSGQPSAGSPQVTVRRMGAVGVPPHQGTHDQDNKRNYRSGWSHHYDPPRVFQPRADSVVEAACDASKRAVHAVIQLHWLTRRAECGCPAAAGRIGRDRPGWR